MSTYFQGGVDQGLDNDAEFQTFIQAWEAAILANGFLVVAADTGQLNMATAVRPAINAYAGYRIYRTNDALHATMPCYLKVEYGLGSVLTRPQLRVTPSTATNGAGTQTGAVGTSNVLYAASLGVALAQFYGSGGASADGFGAWAQTNSPNGTGFMGVFRSVDPTTGLPTADALLFAWSSTATSIQAQRMVRNDSLWSSAINLSVLAVTPDVTLNLHTGSSGARTLLFPPLIYLGGQVYTFAFVLGAPTEIPLVSSASAVPANWFGHSHIWMPMPLSVTTDVAMAALWE